MNRPHQAISEIVFTGNQSPNSARRTVFDTNLNDKVIRVAQDLRKALRGENEINNQFSDADAAEIIHKLGDKFKHDDTNRSTRVQILTLLPSS